MSMFYKEYLLFRDGWDEEAEKEIEETLVQCASAPSWQNQFLPAFIEMLKREQFIKIMECLDRDKKPRIQPRLCRGNRPDPQQTRSHLYKGPAPTAVGAGREVWKDCGNPFLQKSGSRTLRKKLLYGWRNLRGRCTARPPVAPIERQSG